MSSIAQQNNGRSTQRTRPSLRDVSEDVSTVRDHLGALTEDVVGCAAGMAEAGAEAAVERAQATWDTVTDSARASHEKVGTCVSKRPVTSLLIAVGVGALAARLLARR